MFDIKKVVSVNSELISVIALISHNGSFRRFLPKTIPTTEQWQFLKFKTIFDRISAVSHSFEEKNSIFGSS